MYVQTIEVLSRNIFIYILEFWVSDISIMMMDIFIYDCLVMWWYTLNSSNLILIH